MNDLRKSVCRLLFQADDEWYDSVMESAVLRVINTGLFEERI